MFNEKGNSAVASNTTNTGNLPAKQIKNISGEWNVSFDPKWGGPENIVFANLEDWIKRPEEGIKYYSGIAVYKKNFELTESGRNSTEIFLDLGEVNNIARVRLNGTDPGVVWTAPWSVNITDAAKAGVNNLEIEVSNLWVNRLIGDASLPFDGVKEGKWPDWLLEGKQRTSGRYTFTPNRNYKKDSLLLKSGLLGPVKIITYNIEN